MLFVSSLAIDWRLTIVLGGELTWLGGPSKVVVREQLFVWRATLDYAELLLAYSCSFERFDEECLFLVDLSWKS